MSARGNAGPQDPQRRAEEDRDRFLWFIGYRTSKPRWQSNIEAVCLLIIVGGLWLLYRL
jgi:hypothetical protein